MKDGQGTGELNGFLGEGTWVKGEIRFTDTLRVDGKVTGKIISDRELIVGQTGEVEADVEVGVLSVSGKVSGTITVKERIDIHPSGRVYGELKLSAPNLVIEEGGIFEGSIDMSTPADAGARPAVREAEPDVKALHAVRADSPRAAESGPRIES
jgi:cytoskeletal protein CcmA (bactofilin family)